MVIQRDYELNFSTKFIDNRAKTKNVVLKIRKYILFSFISTLLNLNFIVSASRIEWVGLYEVYELTFRTSVSSKNPFETYLLKVEVTDPDGNTLKIDGFYDGNGKDGQDGNIWKARICPDKTGIWRWKTIPGDNGKNNFENMTGEFACYDNGSKGGIIAQGKYFKYQNGPFVFLQGNFLDFSRGLLSTHVYMADDLNDINRKAILKRQLDFHKANKINLYLANKGDYNGKKITPWLEKDGELDRDRMDLKRWKLYDECIDDFDKKGLIASIWFFADDSQYGKLSKREIETIFRYCMARLSSFRNTIYVICLEWEEDWHKEEINKAGNYIQAHNPWNRLLSVHGVSVPQKKMLREKQNFLKRLGDLFSEDNYWEFSDQKWPTFIASQVGNKSNAKEVNELAVNLYKEEIIPHLSEEFGILRNDSDKSLRAKMWANFCGGAAGGGTGSDIASLLNFLQKGKVPFQRMKPSNSLLNKGGINSFCLAEEGHHYAVYTGSGKVSLRVTNPDMVAYWYNVREPSPRFISAGPVHKGQNEFEPPNIGKDWVLWITEKSNCPEA